MVASIPTALGRAVSQYSNCFEQHNQQSTMASFRSSVDTMSSYQVPVNIELAKSSRTYGGGEGAAIGNAEFRELVPSARSITQIAYQPYSSGHSLRRLSQQWPLTNMMTHSPPQHQDLSVPQLMHWQGAAQSLLRNKEIVHKVSQRTKHTLQHFDPASIKAASSLRTLAHGSGSSDSSELATSMHQGIKKRPARKCKAEHCSNSVVQGGLCISHGARRKQCAHPGCSKNVKKAGMCSAHGPARKKCEHENCSNIAVQGGLCISHGAKKRLCCQPGCSKKARSTWRYMCKRHFDENLLDSPVASSGLNAGAPLVSPVSSRTDSNASIASAVSLDAQCYPVGSS